MLSTRYNNTNQKHHCHLNFLPCLSCNPHSIRFAYHQLCHHQKHEKNALKCHQKHEKHMLKCHQKREKHTLKYQQKHERHALAQFARHCMKCVPRHQCDCCPWPSYPHKKRCGCRPSKEYPESSSSNMIPFLSSYSYAEEGRESS